MVTAPTVTARGGGTLMVAERAVTTCAVTMCAVTSAR